MLWVLLFYMGAFGKIVVVELINDASGG